MTRKISFLAPMLIMLMPVGAAFGQGADHASCNTMLDTAIGQGLKAQGYDTTNACNLTLSQLVELKTLLEQDSMGKVGAIELILADAADQ